MDRRRLLCSLASALAVGLAGCGGSGESAPGESTPAETPTTTARDTATETATRGAAATPTPTPTPTRTPVAQEVTVGADGFNFAPENFEIAVGETVRWVWAAGGHNVVPQTLPEGSDWRGTEDEPGGTYDEGYTHTHTFDTAGTYRYYCLPHRSLEMTGRFTVTG